MSRTSNWVAAVAAITVYSSAFGAAPASEQALTAAADASPQTEQSRHRPSPPGQFDFGGNPCQLLTGSGFEVAELSAFDEWQGALTTPIGDHQALAFGTRIDQSDVGSAVDAANPPLATVAKERAHADRLREQRQRLFALGLAVLLNLNAQPH